MTMEGGGGAEIGGRGEGGTDCAGGDGGGTEIRGRGEPAGSPSTSVMTIEGGGGAEIGGRGEGGADCAGGDGGGADIGGEGSTGGEGCEASPVNWDCLARPATTAASSSDIVRGVDRATVQ